VQGRNAAAWVRPWPVRLKYQALSEGDEVLGQADQLEPAGVVGEISEGKIGEIIGLSIDTFEEIVV
jgi:hypothetical protein